MDKALQELKEQHEALLSIVDIELLIEELRKRYRSMILIVEREVESKANEYIYGNAYFSKGSFSGLMGLLSYADIKLCQELTMQITSEADKEKGD